MKQFFLLTFIILALSSNAQIINGIIKDSITNEKIAFAFITNVSTNKTTLSNKAGYFSLTAKPADIISIAAVGYAFDTIHITTEIANEKEFVCILNPLSHTLPSIIVKSNMYSTYQLDSMERRKAFFGTRSQHTQPVFSIANSGAGIGLNLDHFYKSDRDKRKAINLFNQIENEQYINYRFTPQLILKYTSLSTDSTLLFMQNNRPTYKWLRKHTTEEDMVYYINDKLKLFLKK
ncbi:MAG: carboxypeptidase-like regulatory domain-containing protein [Bacteroidetes bacterium]|nr:carboxypeptidase-like regulatory domain-containing protein [Bacteroidota bacterium]MBS1648983.1 carboxypeptidase-like regulatory domain-containing protein [Bacteroidota bacterium]